MEHSMSVVEWFSQASASESGEKALAFISAHPALLWSKHWPQIEQWIATRPSDERKSLTGHLDAIRGFAGLMEQNLSQWPRDQGPIELLASEVISGARTLEQTLPGAKSPAIVDALCPAYVRVLARRTTSQAIDGSWQDAVSIFRLLLAAVDALPPGDGTDDMRWFAGLEWVECVAAACHAVPDGRLFTDARKRGEALAAAEERAGRLERAAEIRHRLGVLHLDPYAAGRNSRSYENQIRMWRERLSDLYGKAVTADPATAVPEPVDAFGTAIGFFERALANRTGEARGRTLKALAEATMWRELAGGPPDREKVAQYAQEALELLPAEKYPAEIPVLRQLLKFAAQAKGGMQTHEDDNAAQADGNAPPEAASAAGSPAQLLWLDPQDVVDNYGATLGISRYLWRAREALAENPDISVSLLLRLWPLLQGPQNEGTRRSVVLDLVNAFVVLFRVRDRLKKDNNDLAKVRSAIAREAQANDWTPGQFAAALAALAAFTTGLDREDEGMPLLVEAIKIAQQVNAPLVAPLNILRAEFILNMAVNAYNANNFDEAVNQYIAAVRTYANEGLVEAAVEALARADDVTFKKSNKPPVALAVGLAADAPMLASRGSPRLNERLQDIWNRVVARTFAKQPINVELLWLEMQSAKGAMLATMLNRPERYDWHRDPDASALLARIEQARATMPPSVSDGAPDDSPIDDELVLMAYVGSRVVEDAGDTVSNLERRFDAHILRRMSDGSGALERHMAADDFRKLLGPRTVFLTQYAGHTEDGNAALITAVLSDETTFGATGVLGLPSATVTMRSGSDVIEMGWFGPMVAALRQSIQSEPGTGAASRDALRTLADNAGNFLGGGVREHLAQLRRDGKDHLCIHPHGPLHFHPQHLVGDPKWIVADDWIVTYVPHPALLREHAQTAKADIRHELVSVGIDFRNSEPHGLAPLPSAGKEANGVAATFGGQCLTNQDATRAALLDSLLGSRRLHIATHGSQDGSAPAFQRLYLWPDQSSGGIFYVYEIVGLDLSHLDLVTLSACETSLGRFDISDTLRGLCAALFTAGVATIVSTLWAVEDSVASFFFEDFYRALKQGSPKLDAFRTAQTDTRQKFPAYRDWGAFQYSGRWR
jgi:hypothetical protein